MALHSAVFERSACTPYLPQVRVSSPVRACLGQHVPCSRTCYHLQLRHGLCASEDRTRVVHTYVKIAGELRRPVYALRAVDHHAVVRLEHGGREGLIEVLVACRGLWEDPVLNVLDLTQQAVTGSGAISWCSVSKSACTAGASVLRGNGAAGVPVSFSICIYTVLGK